LKTVVINNSKYFHFIVYWNFDNVVYVYALMSVDVREVKSLKILKYFKCSLKLPLNLLLKTKERERFFQVLPVIQFKFFQKPFYYEKYSILTT